MRIESLHLEGVGPFENTTIEFPKGTRDDLADVYLLVGENGCGKTTALHAIALALARTAVADLHADGRVLPGGHIKLACEGGEVTLAAARLGTSKSSLDVGGMTQDSTPLRGTYFFEWSRAYRPELELWRDSIGVGQLLGPHPLPWAAFGYSGQRSLSQGNVPALEEDASGPLAGSLSFVSRPDDSMKLANWIAGQRYKQLKAREAGFGDRANDAERSITAIEAAVREVVGRGFSFNFSVEDNHVRANVDGHVVDWAYLPEGVKAIVSWLGDLLMRMSRVKWSDDLPIGEREFLLLLDEVDVHLHPGWQRKILPMVQKLFPRAQIIASTHSPFVVASLTDGAVIELKLDEKGRSAAMAPQLAPLRLSVSATLKSLFGIESDFDLDTENELRALQAASDRALQGDLPAREEFDRIAANLLLRGEEVAQLVQYARRHLERQRPRATGT